MIAKAFQRIGYSVRPDVNPDGPRPANRFDVDVSVGSPAVRHYSQIVPRDFDLSPNFEVINVNVADGTVARTVDLNGGQVNLGATNPASLQAPGASGPANDIRLGG